MSDLPTKSRRRTKPGSATLFEGPESTAIEADRPRHYCIDRADDLPAEIVAQHTHQKHEAIRYYVDICSAVRKKFKAQGGAATYVDLFCGPGRVCEDPGVNFRDGSPLLAWNASCIKKGESDSRFTQLVLGDADYLLLSAAEDRLKARGAQVKAIFGTAEETAGDAVKCLTPGYHFVVLDPYGLAPLPFSVIEAFAKVPHADMLIHFSELGLRRNLGANLQGKHQNLDRSVPGWRDVYDPSENIETNCRAVRNLWIKRVRALGKPVRGHGGVVRRNNVLYWLFLLSAHELAEEFWKKMEDSEDQQRLI